MRYTSTREITRAIKDGDIKPGTVYSKSSGMFQIIDMDGNGDIIGYAAEMEIDDDGNAEPMDERSPITAVDLLNADF